VTQYQFNASPGFYNVPSTSPGAGGYAINNFGQIVGAANAPEAIPEPDTFSCFVGAFMILGWRVLASKKKFGHCLPETSKDYRLS
jgi:hypothetical protein